MNSDPLRLLLREIRKVTGLTHELRPRGEDNRKALIQRHCHRDFEAEEVNGKVLSCHPNAVLMPVFEGGLHLKPECLPRQSICPLHACLNPSRDDRKTGFCFSPFAECPLHIKAVAVWDLEERDLIPKWNRRWERALLRRIKLSYHGQESCLKIDYTSQMKGLLLKISFSCDHEAETGLRFCLLLSFDGERHYPLRGRLRALDHRHDDVRGSDGKQDKTGSAIKSLTFDKPQGVHASNVTTLHDGDVMQSPRQPSGAQRGLELGGTLRDEVKLPDIEKQATEASTIPIVSVTTLPTARATSVPRSTPSRETQPRMNLLKEFKKIEMDHTIIVVSMLIVFLFIVALLGLTMLVCWCRTERKVHNGHKRLDRKPQRKKKALYNLDLPYDDLNYPPSLPPEPTYFSYRERKRHLSEVVRPTYQTNLARPASLSSISSTTSEDHAFEQLRYLQDSSVGAQLLPQDPASSLPPAEAVGHEDPNDTGPVSPESGLDRRSSPKDSNTKL